MNKQLMLLRKLSKWSTSFDIRQHRCCTWTVQPYSPGGANVHPIYRKSETVAMAAFLKTSKSATSSSDSLAQKTHPYNQTACRYHITKVIAHKASYSKLRPNSQNWLLWQRLSAPLGHHLTHDSYGPSEAITQTASRSVQPFLQR